MEEKAIANIAVDKQRNADLSDLKAVNGPFTDSRDVDTYIRNPLISDQEKNNRLYTEVLYARNTSTSFPKASDIFRLKSRYENLDTAEYATNLKIFFDKVSCNVKMEYTDFGDFTPLTVFVSSL